jgi:creatinine amidohydrolase/Fe(II)-dependent formamide hydrolase-like protein
VLPVAATEQHGPHLPVSVDATLLQGDRRGAAAVAARTAGVVFAAAGTA